MMTSYLSDALLLATTAHAGQTRKGLSDPYIVHPTRVAFVGAVRADWGYDMIAAALLHDVVEDCDVTLEDLADHFPQRTVEIVSLVTKPPVRKGETKADARGRYFAAIWQDLDASVLKVLDRTDNLEDARRVLLATGIEHRDWVLRYLDKTLMYMPPLLDRLKGTSFEHLLYTYDVAFKDLVRTLAEQKGN